ncbi:MAG: hypothetical protein WBC44_01595 [Planctomycetaceae bacterium]
MARLIEATFNEGLAPSAVDRERGVIRGVKALGRESKHGRTYSAKALNDAAGLYEGVKVNIDHPNRKAGSIERGFTEAIGELRNASVREDGVYADLHYAKSHPYAELLAESAERFPRKFGLSHVADGDEKRNAGKTIVESINRVISVDVVGSPATNAGLFESEENEMSKAKPRTVKQILESAPDGEPKKRLARLVEAEDLAAEMPVEGVVEPAADPNEDVKAALKKAAAGIVGKMLDGEIDKAEGLKKLRELMGMGEKLGSDSASTPDVPAELPAEMAESFKQLQSKLNLIESKNQLLEAGRKATPELVEAVAMLPAAKRAKLIESLPAADGKGQRPARTGSILRESADDYSAGGSGSYEELAKERRWAKSGA